ncbi:hypothetical protein NP493_5009g00002 [Ridgeia piscesae]|uniref:Uncharacterized protein n=1 Tax=Ridgeia piscesae TaxID=27915 RepID=A0AAD9IWR3_RIDPI|nr:hypothetical protein NP493_5009g00002 [Ridgeia piscesae]
MKKLPIIRNFGYESNFVLTRVTRKQHCLSYIMPHSRCNYQLFSFFEYHLPLELPPSMCYTSEQLGRI